MCVLGRFQSRGYLITYQYIAPDRREPFPKVPLTHMNNDECKYTCDSHRVNSTEFKEKYIYIHTNAISLKRCKVFCHLRTLLCILQHMLSNR